MAPLHLASVLGRSQRITVLFHKNYVLGTLEFPSSGNLAPLKFVFIECGLDCYIKMIILPYNLKIKEMIA